MLPERLRRVLAPGTIPVELGNLFAESGHELYLVGGTVRDAFLGRDHEDLDFATSAHPDEIKRVIGRWADALYTVGEAFGTVGARWSDRLIEITTFRSEVYRDESRKPVVTFGSSIEDDLARRDFTVNALAIRLPEPQVIDPYGGLRDLVGELLRTPIDPHVSFSDDPLRMLRLYRFQATLGFRADSSAVDAVEEMSGRLGIVSAERVRDELSKLMVAPAPGQTLLDLVASGLADHIIPELPALAMEQDPVQRHKDVLAHTAAVVDKSSPRLVLRLAALLHDMGKPATRAFGPGGVSFHHHEVVGARMARDRLRALRYPRDVVDDVSRLVYLHLRPHTLKMGWTDSAVRRYVRDAGPLVNDLNELVRCDVTTANERRERAIQRRIDELEKRIEVLAESEELARLRPPIDGNAVMSYLGVGPGRHIGEILAMLLERRIEEGPYPVSEAYGLVRSWALDHGLEDPGPLPVAGEEE